MASSMLAEWFTPIYMFPIRVVAIILLILTKFFKAGKHPINDVTTTVDDAPEFERCMHLALAILTHVRGCYTC